MRIEIDNFANIKNLYLEMENGKLNFIYGISGSGKSSISRALVANTEDLNEYKTFGCSSDIVVKKEEDCYFKIFDDSSVNEFIYSKSGQGMYDVLFDDNKELKQLKSKLYEFLNSSKVVEVRNVIEKHRNIIEMLQNDLKIGTTNSGAISKKGVYGVLNKSKNYVTDHNQLDIKQKAWIRSGEGYVKDNICPFCSQEMAKDIYERVMKIVDELPQEYDALIKLSDKFHEFGINIDINKINEKNEQDNLKKQIDIKFNILKDLEKIEELLNVSIQDDKALEKKVTIKLIDDTVQLFNTNSIDIVSFIDQLNEGKENYILQKKKYNNILKSKIKSNITEINNHIQNFGIKYRFEKHNILSKTESYILKHVDAESDTSEFLSTGEKNIISLILFVFTYNDKNLIIDDPVSSYDEYRREQIINFIINYRYKGNTDYKTTLILSHDQIFLKFLCNYMRKSKYKNILGNIYHLKNEKGNCYVKDITSKDIDSLMEHILNRIHEIDDYVLQIINLRLFYEVKNLSSIQYSYLSAILHSKKKKISRDELLKKLDEAGITEEKIINKIKNDTNVDIRPFDESEFTVDMVNWSSFEKLCYIRDFVNEGDKKELNNIVHFNYSLFHILNPYKFEFQSEKSYEILDNYIKINNLLQGSEKNGYTIFGY